MMKNCVNCKHFDSSAVQGEAELWCGKAKWQIYGYVAERRAELRRCLTMAEDYNDYVWEDA